MAVSENTCYEVVNIDWLKSLVGSKVQKSDGTTASVSEVSGTTYCPTYQQLTNGTFIPYRSESSDGPASDTDGITVNSTCHATGEAYADNQLVNKHDVAVCNTRLSKFEVAIASSSTNLDACTGGTRNLSYTRTFTRTTWDMSKCETQTESHKTTGDTNDTRNNLVSWTTNIGDIVESTSAGSGKAVTVGKNRATSSSPSTRTITVTGSSTFRGTISTATASVTQNAVTGEWIFWYNDEENERANGVEATTSTGFSCLGGTYTGRAKYLYDVRTYYKWRDKCSTPETYDSITTSEVTSTDNNGTCKAKSGTFTNVKTTGIEGGSKTATLTWNGETQGTATWGSSDVITYTQTCAVPAGCDTSTSHTYSSASSTKDVNCTDQDVAFSVSMPHTATTHYYDDYNVCQTSTTSNTVTATASVHVTRNTGAATSHAGSVSASPGGAISYTINQEGGCTNCESYTSYTNADVTATTTVPCTGGTVASLTGTVTYTAYTVTPSGTGCSTSSSDGSYTAETGELTIPAAGETQTSYTGTKNRINYTVNYEPCTCVTTYDFASEVTITGLTLPCGGGEILIGNNGDPVNPQVLVPYSATCGSSTEELTLPLSVWAYVTPYDFDHDAPGSEQRMGSIKAEYTGPDENVHGVTVNWEGTQSNCPIQICECEDLDIKGAKQ